MKVHIIAPYESMIPIIKACVPLYPDLEIGYSIGDLEKGVELAKLEEENGADAIISRGGTAKLIKKSVNIPVIDMHLSGYDMIRSLTLASELKDKTAIVGFSNITSGAQSIIDLLDLPLQVYTVRESKDVAPLILTLKNEGYKQIVGDVITINTTISYGMKGFLIQSGKESIIRAINDAREMITYLQYKSDINRMFERLLVKEVHNIVILNSDNQIVYEHLADFDSNPLTDDQCRSMNGEVNVSKQLHTSFSQDGSSIEVDGFCHEGLYSSYGVFVLDASPVKRFDQKGVQIKAASISEPIAMDPVLINNVTALYKNHEIIHLKGNRGTGKEFLVDHIHNEQTKNGKHLIIDFKEFKEAGLNKLPLEHIRTITLKNIDCLQDHEPLREFLSTCCRKNLSIFIVSNVQINEAVAGNFAINTIHMQDLSQRKSDIGNLTKFFLSYYHQTYGTTAMNIKRDALALLEEYSYPNNIDDLKQLIKQMALNEKEYVIRKETIEKIIADNNIPTDIFVSQKATLKEMEKYIIQRVLKEENYNQTKTAERLGINRATLWRKLKE
ncbi:PrpR N-terminal domain-containing protein [Bacillus sp. SD075]|uniref:PrpR N-terminal domain-containing protein n=1 Tax=Bacillus sp. SD075 TaxID=2781732 RepID=UPI001A9764A0|nr:sigma-54-dependent transcriptional regulator [Bacillus sp. SD075]MBO0996205.1 PrpR N-terminal domain-containing protein [Bacillus sp. SD075]